MEDLNKYITLNNGTKMPMIGYGTFLNDKSEEKILFDTIVYAVTELEFCFFIIYLDIIFSIV